MRNLSSEFRRAWYYGEANKLGFADITLEDGTTFNFTNEQIWAGGLSTDDMVSDDNSFTALGSAIIGSAALVINNISEEYSNYDFMNAYVILYAGMELPLPDGSGTYLDKIRLGTYHVDNPHYNGSTITLELLDNMEQFDRPYETTLSYPATLASILRDACQKCNVPLATQTFPRSTLTISEKPDSKSTTYREVVGWISAIAGCFAKCNASGALELKWFDITSLEQWNRENDGGTFNPWNTGTDIDGGTFNPWNTGTDIDGGTFTEPVTVHYIGSLYSQDICVDDTIITGVRILVKDTSAQDSSAVKEYVSEQTFSGVASYIIEISENPFITDSNVSTILSALATQLIGVRFRKMNISHRSTVALEAGDVAIVWDRKDREYPILVTHTSFEIGASQSTVCGSETPARNKSTRFTNSLKNYVENRKALMKERTAWQAAEEDLIERIDNANGLYQTDETTQSGTIHYLHNKPLLEDSDIRIMISDVGVHVTANGTAQTPTWYGLTVDGTLIANILNANGINADWINAGSLSLGGTAQQGFSRDGAINIYNSSGTLIGKWDKSGIQIFAGSIDLGNGQFQVSSEGAVAAKSLTANDYVYVDGTVNSLIRIPFRYEGNDGIIELSKDGFWTYHDGQKDVAWMVVRLRQIGIVPNQTNYIPEMQAVSYLRSRTAVAEYSPYSFDAQELYNDGSYYVHKFCRIGTYLYSNLREFCGIEISRHYDNNTTAQLFFDVNKTSDQGQIVGDLAITGKLSVTGTKTRLVSTEDYGQRFLYCYETPTPMFGDIGDGVVGDDGLCYIPIDPTFSETASTNLEYQVFLQKYGNGDIFVAERHSTYFVVHGTPGLAFGWEIKARQRDYETLRLDKRVDDVDIRTTDYGEKAIGHIEEINRERTVIE